MNDIEQLKEIEQEKGVKKRAELDNNAVIAGVMILVGVALLIGNLTSRSFENWWALFMLIPAGFMLMNLWRDYQENGRFTRKSSGSIIPMIIILTMVAIFLFDLSWTIFWPASLVAVGLGILLGARS